MRRFTTWFTGWYGANPLHLLTLVACFALAAYAALKFVPSNPIGVAVWFGAAIVLHDLMLVPLYSLADRSVAAIVRRRPLRLPGRIWLAHVRVPVIGSALLFLVFFPMILGLPSNIEKIRGESSLLDSWLLLTGLLFAGSAVVLAIRLGRRARRPAQWRTSMS